MSIVCMMILETLIYFFNFSLIKVDVTLAFYGQCRRIFTRATQVA